MIVSLIVTLIVLGLIWWLVDMLPIPSPIANIIRGLFLILAVVIVLNAFGFDIASKIKF